MSKTAQEIEDAVRSRYAGAAKAVSSSLPMIEAATESCCSTGYTPEELADLPDAAVAASLGCANPITVADLKDGDVVLDLGSGGGIDVLLSAKRVAPNGKAYGLDMTDEMLELARANQVKAGVENAEFLKGKIEAIPLPDGSVDAIVSNCVINLSADKPAVFSEAHRVLKSGGRFAVADIVADEGVPPDMLANLEAWSACIAGALTRNVYRSGLADAGFENIQIEDSQIATKGFVSAIIKATKP